MAQTSTTGAVVLVTGLSFDEGNQSNVMMYFDLRVDGPTPDAGGVVTFPRDAIQSVKATAVRNFVNAHIGSYEPNTPPLTNINIQISGMPV
jgi:hypothetical protein